MRARIRSCHLAILWAAPLIGVWGCAGYPPNVQITRDIRPRIEERYRIFFSREVPVNSLPGDAPEDLAKHFVPGTAVASSLEEFDRQGFKLTEVEPIPWGEGATLFVFQRPMERLPEDETPLRSPINFVGTFRVEDDNPNPTYYVFNQTTDGYKIQVVGHGDIGVYDAKWEGRELIWQTPEGKNNARLTPDGRVLYRIIETAAGLNDPRETIIEKAHRVLPLQKPDSADAREARRYVIRLAPQTPRYYDPYPW